MRTAASDWVAVQTGDGEKGWVAAAFIDCKMSIEALPVVSADRLPLEPPTSAPHEVPTDVLATQLPFEQPSPTPERLLNRHDAPPEGVDAQLEAFAVGGGPVCGLKSKDTPRVFTGTPSNAGVFICFEGFAPHQDIDALVILPDGVVRKNTVLADSDGISMWSWYSLSGDPSGEYTVTATQGNRQAKAIFTLNPASQFHILVLPKGGPVGTSFQIVLAGFQPNQLVPLHLYRHADCSTFPGGCWEYVTTLPPVQVNEHGSTITTLVTQPDDPAGGYLVVAVPIPKHNTAFDPGAFGLGQ